MSEDKKHRSLPYAVFKGVAGNYHIDNANRDHVAAVYTDANAEFIVLACNSHYELLAALKYYANKTQVVEEYCPGNHTNYSSMHDLPDCPLCGKNEDTRGGIIHKTVPHSDGQVARAAIAKAEGK